MEPFHCCASKDLPLVFTTEVFNFAIPVLLSLAVEYPLPSIKICHYINQAVNITAPKYFICNLLYEKKFIELIIIWILQV